MIYWTPLQIETIADKEVNLAEVKFFKFQTATKVVANMSDGTSLSIDIPFATLKTQLLALLTGAAIDLVGTDIYNIAQISFLKDSSAGLIVNWQDGTYLLIPGETVASMRAATDIIGAFLNGGVTDHGELEGLDDNDHPQYMHPSGQEGEVFYLTTNDSNDISPDFIFNRGRFIETDEELADAKLDLYSLSSVFSDWYRFSHDGTSVYPADAGEAAAWSYDAGEDAIVLGVNSNTYVGFISPLVYEHYSHSARLHSTGADDDLLGLVIAFVVDEFGDEHTLSAVRSVGGEGITWQIVYNRGHINGSVIADGNTTCLWGNGGTGATTAEAGYVQSHDGGSDGWDQFEPNGTSVRVARNGDIITAETTQLGSLVYDNATLLSIDLDDPTYPELAIFKGAKRYGYIAHSQADGRFDDPLFSENNIIYDTRAPYDVWLHNGSEWYVEDTRTIFTDYGVGRLFYNEDTKKMFYTEQNGLIKDVVSINLSSWQGPVGKKGEALFITEDDTSDAETAFTLFDARFIETDEELAQAKALIYTLETVFNTWGRFSHNTSHTYPANASEINDWSYSAPLDQIVCTVNSVTFIGFVSPELHEKYKHSIELSSPDSDDDCLGAIIAFVTDEAGREHTLSALRVRNLSQGHIDVAGTYSQWQIVYNYHQQDEWRVADGAAFVTNSQGSWSSLGANGTKVEVTRNGDLIDCVCSQFGTLELDYNTTLSINLASDPRLTKFRGPAKYGYCSNSQRLSTYTNPIFSEANVIYDTRNPFDTWVWTGDWAIEPGRTLYTDFGTGKLLYSPSTEKIYFSQPDKTIRVTTGATTSSENSILTTDQLAAINGANAPAAGNVFATSDDLIDMTANELAAIKAGNAPTGANPFVTQSELDLQDELTYDELTAINVANAPNVDNPFATIADIALSNELSVDQQAALDAATTANAGNPFATLGDIALSNELTGNELLAIQNANAPTSVNTFITQNDMPAAELSTDIRNALYDAFFPSATNVFATMNDIALADELTADQAAAIDSANSPSALNVFATINDLPPDELTVDQAAAIDGATNPSALNVFATMGDLVGDGHTIQDSSSNMIDRANLNFVGFDVTDDVGNDSTTVTAIAPSSGFTIHTFLSNATQTKFYGTYTPGEVLVFHRGVLLDPSMYTADDGASVTLNTGAAYNDEINIVAVSGSIVYNKPPIMMAASDEVTPLTAGQAKLTFRMPYAYSVLGVRASLTTAPAGADVIVDINRNGVSILGTLITINAGSKTSVDTVIQPTLLTSNLNDDDEITIDIDQVGSVTAGTGLKVTLV